MFILGGVTFVIGLLDTAVSSYTLVIGPLSYCQIHRIPFPKAEGSEPPCVEMKPKDLNICRCRSSRVSQSVAGISFSISWHLIHR